MRTKWIALVAVLGLGLSLPTVGYGQADPAKPAPGKPAMSGPTAGTLKPAAGEVVKADPATKTLVIKPEGSDTKEMTFSVKETATGNLAGLKAGDKVMVQFVDAGGGKLIVESITKQ